MTDKNESEVFDKERAMATIKKLRGIIKDLENNNKILRGVLEEAKTNIESYIQLVTIDEKRIVALNEGLPLEAASRLIGDGVDEYTTDARRLLALLRGINQPPGEYAPEDV